MKQETKDKLKKFGKGAWDVLKFCGGVVWFFIDPGDYEEEEKKKRQEKEEQEQLAYEQEQRRKAYEQAQQEKAEREALAAKYGSMTKQETIVAALENHDKIKKLEADNASLRRSNANLRSENRYVKEVANGLQDTLDEVARQIENAD